MKAQVQLMEYLILAVFIVGFMFFIMVFLAGYQQDQFAAEREQLEVQRITGLMKQFLVSPFLASERGVFEAGRLEGFAGRCSEMQGIFGKGWFIEITVFDGKRPAECKTNTLGKCNVYRFCTENGEGKSISLEMPVNVLGESENGRQMLPANMIVGVYK